MSRLAVPAVLISAPKANTSVGIISSPPATPSKLLTKPISRPQVMPALMRHAAACGSNPAPCWGRKPSIIKAAPIPTSNKNMIRSRGVFDSRAPTVAPTKAATTAPPISARIAAVNGCKGASVSVRPRMASEAARVTRLTARLSGIAWREG
jgi:hypothetical protein